MTQASVLVVEDNDLERQITADTLREEGFAVEEAAVGKRAIELLALSRFDVVLTDLMMPGMSGDELLAKVRAAYPGSQVVVLTAHGTIDSAVQAMKTGAFYYLTKPTDRETLEWHRQGSRGQGDPSLVATRRWAVCRDQLFGNS